MRIVQRVSAAVLLLCSSLSVNAEDIDIYGAVQPDGANPNLMILLDNASAWNGATTFDCPGFSVPANNQNTVAGFEQCGLYTAASAIGDAEQLLGNINMGLTMFAPGSTLGGQLKFPAASPYTMPTMDAAGIANFKAMVASIDRQADNSNASAVGAGMQEVWAYYQGETGLSGTTYDAHFSSACQRNFVVYIANATNNGKPQDQGQTAENALTAAGANSAQMTSIDIPDPYDKYEANYGDEWARFMYQTDMSADLEGDQNIVTYTIILTDGSNPEYVEFLKSMAAFGGGKSFLVTLGDMDALVQALLQIFNEVQGVNSAFSSSSLPVSANTQGTFLNQVFMGVFRPDESSLPRWQGNLKQYEFGLDNNDRLLLVDSQGDAAISSSGTGFISPNAVSFWTSKDLASPPDSLGGFWRQKPQSASGGFDSPDGEVVEKGGAHQQIRLANLLDNYSSTPASDARKLYTCAGGCGSNGAQLSASPFASSNADITAALLGTTSPSISITSIERDDTGNLATVTLASAPSPALTAGQLVTISGAQYAAFNGIFSITPTDATHFTFPLPATDITPITPATGSFTVSAPGGTVAVASLTRVDTTVTATTSSAHGFAIGSTLNVTITGSDQGEYNGTNVTASITGADTFTYPLNGVENPTTPGGAGTATVGGSSLSIPAGGIVRTGTNVTVTGPNNSTKTWSAGNSVIISGASPSGYDGTWTITGVGNACAGGANNKSFCFTIPVTPVTPATTGTNISADFGAVTAIPISSISRGASTCPTSAVATVTVDTAGPHGYTSGAVVSIAGTALAANESAYATTATITVVDPDTFTYPLAVTPACTDTTSGMLAKPTGGDRDTLISWIRGKDNAGDEPSPDTSYATVNIRPSVHGDVLHSRPVAVNYGGTIGVVVFYGANDGVFRAVNGNQVNPASASAGLSTPGSELWGFVAPEFFGKFDRLRQNSPQIKLFSTPDGIDPAPQPREYFFDGSTGVYQNPATGKVYLYLSARRGGRLIYALDVSDPLIPKFMWKRTNTDTGFAELGQTWSQPKVVRVKGHTNPVVVFGAGYDPNEDAEPPLADSMGRGIFMLDALDGSLVWQAGPAASCASPCVATTVSGMTYAMPSDVSVLDRDRDGSIDRLYAPDLGGNVWRVDLEPAAGNDPADWQVSLLASLGGTGATKRKIFYPPDIVPTNDFDAVLVGTGDREHPVAGNQATAIKNRFYMLKDTVTGKTVDAGWSAIEDDTSATSFNAPSDLFDATATLFDNSQRGFYINLLGLDDLGVPQSGEKVVNAPTTVGGITFFGTNQPLAPDANTCQANLGTARGYGVDFFTGAHYAVEYDGGGLPPTPVVGVVVLDNGKPRQFCIGCAVDPDKPEGPPCEKSSIAGCETSSLVDPTRTRSYWYEK